MMEKQRAYIFIDASNIHYSTHAQGWRIDWVKFQNHYKEVFETPRFYYYEGVVSKGVYFDNNHDKTLRDFNEAKKRKLNFFKFLRQHNYIVRHKPVTRVYDNTKGEFDHKCNFDVELTIDAIDNINNYNVFYLLSGDGDFERLVKYLKNKGKKTIIIASKDRLSNNLRKAANVSIYLRKIKNDIKQ